MGGICLALPIAWPAQWLCKFTVGRDGSTHLGESPLRNRPTQGTDIHPQSLFCWPGAGTNLGKENALYLPLQKLPRSYLTGCANSCLSVLVKLLCLSTVGECIGLCQIQDFLPEGDEEWGTGMSSTHPLCSRAMAAGVYQTEAGGEGGLGEVFGRMQSPPRLLPLL